MILSIVIVNWNGKELTENCIESILLTSRTRLENKEFEIIVIDNGSTDESLEYLKAYSRPVKFISNVNNVGYAPACNQGMKEAQGKYILLLGNDTVVLDEALEKCVKYLDENNDCGAVGCRLLNSDGSVQNNCKKFPKFINGFFVYLSLDRLNRDYDMGWFKYDETREVEQISTTFLMIRKSLLEKIGYFDESYKILYNDVDLCKRIWESGFKVYFLSTAEIIHLGSQSTQKADFSVRKIMYKDIYRYYRKNFGIKAAALIPILALRLLLTAAFKK
jgi:GT2 family glycosyltransferase